MIHVNTATLELRKDLRMRADVVSGLFVWEEDAGGRVREVRVSRTSVMDICHMQRGVDAPADAVHSRAITG